MKSIIHYLYESIKAIVRLLFWYLELLIPRDKNRWVFGAWFGKRYADNSRAMYEYVLKKMPYIKAVWLTSNPEVYNKLKSENKPVQYLNSVKGKFFALTAKVAFITVERDEVNRFYLNGAKLVWLYHGMVIKQIMEDEKHFLQGKTKKIKTLKNYIIESLFPYFYKLKVDCVLETSDFFTPFFSSAFLVDKNKIWVDGYPRNDELFSKEKEVVVSYYREKFPTSKFIMHMPTHRLHGFNGNPYNPFAGNKFNINKFFRCLEEGNYVYFYKGHFYDGGNNTDFKHERFVQINDSDYDNLYRFIKDMDILITDYSSIYFDFLLLKRPIILTPFDYSEYTKNERPMYYDYFEHIKGNVVNDWDDLIKMLSDGSYDKPSDIIISKFHTYRDCQSCERIAEHIKKEWL